MKFAMVAAFGIGLFLFLYSVTTRTVPNAAKPFNHASMLKVKDTIYIFGMPCTDFYDSIHLMRVREQNILDKSAYEYFAGYDSTGNPVWSPDQQATITIAGGPARHISVRFNKFLNRYIMTHNDEEKSGIVIRESPTPWGPWSAPLIMVKKEQYPAAYGAFLIDGFDAGEGQVFYYIMTEGNAHNTSWMKTSIEVRGMPLREDEGPPSVAITFPKDGQAVFGPVQIIVEAVNDAGLTKVALLINGQPFGIDSTPPYLFLWDTMTMPNGSYALSAIATDFMENKSASPPVTVNIENLDVRFIKLPPQTLFIVFGIASAILFLATGLIIVIQKFLRRPQF